MVSRLAALLTGSGSMKWTAAHGVYSCDLGLGGKLVPVGTSVQIWEQKATVTAATMQRPVTVCAPRTKPPGQIHKVRCRGRDRLLPDRERPAADPLPTMQLRSPPCGRRCGNSSI